MADGGAERTRQYRERLRAGLTLRQVVVDDAALADVLTLSGLLAPDDADDDQAIQAALQTAIDLWTGRE